MFPQHRLPVPRLLRPGRTFPSGMALLAAVMLPFAAPAAGTGDVAAFTGDRGEVIHDILPPVPGEIGPDVPFAIPGMPMSPPDNPQVGDSWLWWLWVHSPMPPHFEQHMCTVRGVSEHGYVVVRNTDWMVSMDQADVDAILERWENSSIGPYPAQGIYELDSNAFGTPPDELDNDPRIYLVWFDFAIAADGFFFYFDEYPEGTFPQYHSNECEVVYLSTTSSGGPGGDYMLAVVAHEFEHMIHWLYDEDETSWVNEGMAELAMWLYGNPDTISGFSSNPDNNLTVWEGVWADYIKTYLWSLYFYEQYGGQPAIYAALHDPANSIQGYENTLDALGYAENFDDVFADWIVANYLDDTTIEDGRFGYAGDDLPPFGIMGTYSTYPVVNIYKTVNHWAADYYRFQSLSSYGNLLLTFDGDNANSFAVWALAMHNGGATEVHRMTLDGPTQTGTLEINGMTDPADKVILAVGGASSTGGTGYYFSGYTGQGITPEEGPGISDLQIQASPNPFSSTVVFDLAWTGDVSAGLPGVEIFDIGGRLVARLAADVSADGATVIWDGTDSEGTDSPSGVYIARATASGRSCSTSLILMR